MSEIDVVPLDKILTDRIKILIMDKKLKQLEAENEKLKDTIKEMEDDLDDWISDVSILYTYDDGKPNNLDELQCCMEHVHEEWSKYKQCLDEIEDRVQDLDNYSENNMVIMNDILQLIKQSKEGT